MKKLRGISLIELVISIVIIGVIGTSLLPVIALEGKPELERTTQAISLAKERMEIIIGNREANGFTANDPDPCKATPHPAICDETGDYTVTSTTTNWNGNSNLKLVTVTVTGPSTVTLRALLTNY